MAKRPTKTGQTMRIEQERPQDEVSPGAAMSLVLGRLEIFSRAMPAFDRDRTLEAAEANVERRTSERRLGERRSGDRPTGDRRSSRRRDPNRTHGNAIGCRMDIITATNRVLTVISDMRPQERVGFPEIKRRTNLTWFFTHAALDRLCDAGVLRNVGFVRLGGVGRTRETFEKLTQSNGNVAKEAASC
jgi:hypothetical protein